VAGSSKPPPNNNFTSLHSTSHFLPLATRNSPMGSNDVTEVDILITGAGLSGINAAYRVQTELPHKSFTILEARDKIGGTWGFWKYPGIRSDSTMRLFGLSWYPWPSNVVMAEGPVIQKYLEDAAASEGLDKKIRFGHRVTSSSWSSEENRWTVSADVLEDGKIVAQKKFKAAWIMNGTGYYNYGKPLPTVIPGLENFGGRVVHPQFWGDDGEVNWAGKRVVIIGSGATAVTLLPHIAKTAAHVTMLQRSPSYVFSLESSDPTHGFWKRFLPARWASTVHWWHRMMVESFFTLLCSNLAIGRRIVRSAMRAQLPAGFDMDTHFNPTYAPFEQRLCFCPDGDFFKALRNRRTTVVTGSIDTVTEAGIKLTPSAKFSSSSQANRFQDAPFIPADLIITATGLYVELLSGMSVTVDDEPVDLSNFSSKYTWNGVMMEGMPNTGLITGYTAGTWTPGADARTRQMIKVIKHLDKSGAQSATPYLSPEERGRLPKKPAMPNSSTYLVAARDRMPRSAGVGPWRNPQTFWEDTWHLYWGNVKNGMKFGYGGGSKKDD